DVCEGEEFCGYGSTCADGQLPSQLRHGDAGQEEGEDVADTARPAVLHRTRFTVESTDSDPYGGCSATGEVTKEQSYYPERVKRALTPKEARMTGWRIDNLAALAACMSLIVSKQGKSERKELEQIIGEKVGRWRALTLTDAFLRSGYLEEDEEGLMKIGWRTRAELDLESLMMLIAESKPKGAIVEEEPGEVSESAEPLEVEGPAEAVEAELEDQASTEG